MSLWFFGSVAVIVGLRGCLKLFNGITGHEPTDDEISPLMRDIKRPIQEQSGRFRPLVQIAILVQGAAEVTAACAALMWGIQS